MKFKYRAWNDEIEKIEIERETKHFVVLAIKGFDGKNMREAKDGFRRYFETWQEAHQYLIDACKRKLESAIGQVEYLEAKLQAIKDMEEACQ